MKPVERQLGQIAASPVPLPERSRRLLTELRRLVGFDSAWLAYADTAANHYDVLATLDLDSPVADYLGGPVMAREITVTGTNQPRPPMSPSDLSYPVEELQTWAECLIPGGYQDALAVALYTPDRRQVGYLALLSQTAGPPPQPARERLAQVVPLLAQAVDPMRSLRVLATVVHGATAGVVLRTRAGTQPLPGLPGHEVLEPGSWLLEVAVDRLSRGQVHASFLWPLGDPRAPEGHTQVTVLASTAEVPAAVSGLVVLSPPGELRGLTARELEVLGLLVDGRSNQEIAKALMVTPRTVAAHLEHISSKLVTSSRTSAAVLAEREGLYVPALAHAGHAERYPPRRRTCSAQPARTPDEDALRTGLGSPRIGLSANSQRGWHRMVWTTRPGRRRVPVTSPPAGGCRFRRGRAAEGRRHRPVTSPRCGRPLMTPPNQQARRRRRALAHQCPDCREHWALQLIDHPAGLVVRCRFCQKIQRTIRPTRTSASYPPR